MEFLPLLGAGFFGHFILGTALFLSSSFLILLIMVQKGKGGGLTGALGGMGGQSAFGTKAGDVFTKITVVTALIWIVFCILSIQILGERPAAADSNQSEVQQPADDDDGSTSISGDSSDDDSN